VRCSNVHDIFFAICCRDIHNNRHFIASRSTTWHHQCSKMHDVSDWQRAVYSE